MDVHGDVIDSLKALALGYVVEPPTGVEPENVEVARMHGQGIVFDAWMALSQMLSDYGEDCVIGIPVSVSKAVSLVLDDGKIPTVMDALDILEDALPEHIMDEYKTQIEDSADTLIDAIVYILSEQDLDYARVVAEMVAFSWDRYPTPLGILRQAQFPDLNKETLGSYLDLV